MTAPLSASWIESRPRVGPMSDSLLGLIGAGERTGAEDELELPGVRELLLGIAGAEG